MDQDAVRPHATSDDHHEFRTEFLRGNGCTLLSWQAKSHAMGTFLRFDFDSSRGDFPHRSGHGEPDDLGLPGVPA